MIKLEVGDVWFCDWAEGLVAVKSDHVNVGFNTNFIATKELETGEYGVKGVDLFHGCQLIEREGKRGQALWETLPYEDCPKEWHDMLQQKWDEGYVIEVYIGGQEWKETFMSNVIVSSERYRITDRKREVTPEPQESPKERPKFKLFKLNGRHWGRYCVGRQLAGYRIFGFTDDENWQLGHHCFEIVPCNAQGNRKYAIGRLES